MITSDRFLREIRIIYRPGFILSKGASKLISWCLDYYEEYERAPGKLIENIFHSKDRDNSLDTEELRYIEDLLASLSDEYENQDKFNSDYIIKQSEGLFKRRSLQMLTEDIQTDLAAGDPRAAEARFNQYKPIARSSTVGINPFTDSRAVKDAFEYDTESLFTVPGRLGEIMNSQFTRASMIAIQAPEKRGKSYILDYLSRRAYMARCNVAYFDLGDMTEGQKVRRFQSSVNEGYVIGPPMKTITYPIMDCVLNQDDSCNNRNRNGKIGLEDQKGRKLIDWVNEMNRDRYIACSRCRPSTTTEKFNHCQFKPAVWYEIQRVERLNWRKALRKATKWTQLARNARFKLSLHESDSLSVKGMDEILDHWEHFEGFIADVVIADYMDIATVGSDVREFRHQENTKWKSFRGLTQKRNICGITVTQADAGSYSKDSQDLTNFSEDKRKYGHVTAMYALNQTPEEKRKQILRIGELVVRENDFDMHRQVTVTQCLSISKPYVDSF